METIELEFDFEMNDWTAFQRNHLKTSKRYQWTKIFIIALFPIIAILNSISGISKGNFDTTQAIVFGLISIVWVIYFATQLDKRTLSRAQKMIEAGDNSGILGKNKVILEPEAITLIQPASEQKIKWSGINKLEENEAYFFLYNSAISAIIIPKQKVNVESHSIGEYIRKNLHNLK